MSLIEKIDAEIARYYLIINDTEHYTHSTIDYYETKVEALEDFKEIILSEQKKALTIGDKIRDSNESLAEALNYFKYGVSGNTFTLKTILERLNQPSTGTEQHHK